MSNIFISNEEKQRWLALLLGQGLKYQFYTYYDYFWINKLFVVFSFAMKNSGEHLNGVISARLDLRNDSNGN